jgi:hypothetical protein
MEQVGDGGQQVDALMLRASCAYGAPVESAQGTSAEDFATQISQHNHERIALFISPHKSESNTLKNSAGSAAKTEQGEMKRPPSLCPWTRRPP